jgi:excisionase family DNA binding protein
VSFTPKLKQLVRTATTQFKLLNRNRSLSSADRKQLKTFYLARILNPQVHQILRQDSPSRAFPGRVTNDRMAGQSLLTAQEVEAWLKIDVKTLYKYAADNVIPHIRLKGNVRFPARELREWLRRHSHLPATMRIRHAPKHRRR